MALQVIRNDQHFLIIESTVDGQTFTVSTPLGNAVQTPPGVLIVNANYIGFEHPPSTPLGIMVDQGVRLVTDPFVPDRPRSALVVDAGVASIIDPLTFNDAVSQFHAGAFASATVIQAGPRLVKAGVELNISLNPEQFGSTSGALAFNDHVAIGIKADGSLIFVYAHQTHVQNLAANMLAFGAIDALKCDGGAGAFLQANTATGVHHRGVRAPFTALTVG